MTNIENVVVEICIKDEMYELKFSSKESSQEFFITDQGIIIKLELEDGVRCYDAKRVDNLGIYKEESDTIVQLFIDKYNECMNQLIEDLENGVEFVQEENSNDPNIIVPYNPKLIRVTQGRFSLKEIYEMINGNEYDEPILDLSPDFQRSYVWDNTRKSRLIESILLKIPLPVFYLARDNEGKYQVVDGVQRLSAINEFFSNGFKLRNLEYLKDECDNKYFQDDKYMSLHPKFARHLRSYQIDCNIIEPDTPHRVKLDIFKRLNTGGRSLNNQEIRNSILRKNCRDFIRKLANSSEFKLTTNDSINPKRMMDQELVTRFIGFYLLYKQPNLFPSLEYNSNMNDFLDNIVEILNKEHKRIPFDTIEREFLISMENAYIMFRDYAFRKVDIEYEYYYKNRINKSLFTTFSILLSNYDTSIIKKRGTIIDEFAKVLLDDKLLFSSITYGSNDKLRIDTTFIRIEEFLNLIYGG